VGPIACRNKIQRKEEVDIRVKRGTYLIVVKVEANNKSKGGPQLET
jgi:hypothetical protein